MFFGELLNGTVNAIRKAANGYNEYGLRFSVKHLQLMFPKILSLPIEEQAEYVDYVTLTNINKDWFINQIKQSDIDEHIIQTSNTTSIGNAAYIALNCKDEVARKKMINNLEKIKEHFKNQ